MQNLYFIALIPHVELQEKITHLKNDMAGKYKAKHALKSPAHITLQMPFKRPAEFEDSLIKELEVFAESRKVFQVDLDGFGCFTPRVIYVQVKEHSPIVDLHAALTKMLTEKLSFSDYEVSSGIHPHCTIATRDLTKEMFFKAWKEYKNKEFQDSFLAKSLYLLKHNGKSWDIYKDFRFRG